MKVVCICASVLLKELQYYSLANVLRKYLSILTAYMMLIDLRVFRYHQKVNEGKRQL